MQGERQVAGFSWWWKERKEARLSRDTLCRQDFRVFAVFGRFGVAPPLLIYGVYTIIPVLTYPRLYSMAITIPGYPTRMHLSP